MNKPLVSVIMSVYNTEESFLSEAINSILNQSYDNIEFIIIDDASDNRIYPLIKKIKDQRIKLIENPSNLGLTASLNKAVNISKGKYIARMDSDDIALRKRLEKQVAYLEKNIDVGVLGTQSITIGSVLKKDSVPTEHEEIKAGLMINSMLIHPTVMMESELLKRNLYNEEYRTTQDYELWSRLIWKTKFANLDEILLKRRIHEGQVTNTANTQQRKLARKTRKNILKRLIPDIKESDIDIFGKNYRTKKELEQLQKLSNKLISCNASKKTFSNRALIKVLSRNLDAANYIYTRNTQRLPMRKLRVSPHHISNKYSYQKYVGGVIGVLSRLF